MRCFWNSPPMVYNPLTKRSTVYMEYTLAIWFFNSPAILDWDDIVELALFIAALCVSEAFAACIRAFLSCSRAFCELA